MQKILFCGFIVFYCFLKNLTIKSIPAAKKQTLLSQSPPFKNPPAAQINAKAAAIRYINLFLNKSSPQQKYQGNYIVFFGLFQQNTPLQMVEQKKPFPGRKRLFIFSCTYWGMRVQGPRRLYNLRKPSQAYL